MALAMFPAPMMLMLLMVCPFVVCESVVCRALAGGRIEHQGEASLRIVT
jgi:hypothetical protein